MKNDLGNKTRRRKVALIAREENLTEYEKQWRQLHAVTPVPEEKKEQTRIVTARVERTKAEIETLKKRIGHG